MEYLISAIWILLEMSSIMLFSAAFLNAKYTWKHTLPLLTATWIAVYVITYIECLSIFRIPFTLLIYLCVSRHLFTGSILSHAFFVLINYVFICIVDIAMCFGISALMGISMSELMWRRLTYTAVGTIGKLLLLFIVWLLWQYRKKKSYNRISNKWFAITLLFPLVSFIIVAFYFYTSQSDTDISLTVVLVGSVLAIANIGLLYLIYNLEKATEHEQTMLLLKQQMILQAKNIHALEQNYRVQRTITHEFEHHLLTLKDLLAQSHDEAASLYLQELINNRSPHLVFINSHHPIIDVVLNEKYRAAQNHSINMQIKVNDLSNICISSDTLVVLLTNLLDNALEAAQNCSKKKEIHCNIILEDTLYISIRNTCNPVTIVDGNIPSTKEDKQNHGYGIPAIKFILAELQAEYTFDYSDGWFQFVIEIPYM